MAEQELNCECTLPQIRKWKKNVMCTCAETLFCVFVSLCGCMCARVSLSIAVSASTFMCISFVCLLCVL